MPVNYAMCQNKKNKIKRIKKDTGAYCTCEYQIKKEAQGETQSSLRGLLHSNWLLDFTWTLHDIPTTLSGFSNGEIQLSPAKCSSAQCMLNKSLSSSKKQYNSSLVFNTESFTTISMRNTDIFRAGLNLLRLSIQVSTSLLKYFGHLFISEWMRVQVRHNDRVRGFPLDSSPSRIYCTRTGSTHL